MVSLKAWQIEEKSEFGTFGFQTQVNSWLKSMILAIS